MSRVMSLLALGVVAAALAACGSSSKSTSAKAVPVTPSTPSTATTATTAAGGYTPAARRDFLGGCEQKTPARACECMFAYLQAHVSYEKLKADVVKNGTSSRIVRTAAVSCVGKR